MANLHGQHLSGCFRVIGMSDLRAETSLHLVHLFRLQLMEESNMNYAIVAWLGLPSRLVGVTSCRLCNVILSVGYFKRHDAKSFRIGPSFLSEFM